jgi:hypothetical protein
MSVRWSPEDSGFFQIKGGVIMTTNAAAVSPVRRATNKLVYRAARAVVFTAAALALAGCETSSGLVNGAGPTASTLAPVQTPAPAAAKTRMALAPVIGAPDGVAKQLSAQLLAAIERQNVVVAKTTSERVDFTLRGYVVAAKDKSATKVSYIWDITDPSGKRVHRITGEESVPGGTGKDAWSSVSAATVQTVADKTASSLGAWLPSAPASASPASSSGALGGADQTVASAGGNGLVQQASASGQQVAATPLGAAGRVAVSSPKVSGAPGDGNNALSSAMRRELGAKGVEITEAAAGTYKVLADVKLKAKADGNQAITIDWIVNDPAGTRIATVTQNNDIPKGHLDGSWGQNADDAARGAAIQIKQVIADHNSGKPIKPASQTASAQ